MKLDSKKIYWELVHMTGDSKHHARVEGEKYGKYYTATCQWEDDTPTEVQDIEEIPENELHNKTEELKRVN